MRWLDPLQICEKLEDTASVFSICWTRVYNYLGKHPQSEPLTFKYELCQWHPSDHVCAYHVAVVFTIGWGKGKSALNMTHLHYDFDKHDWGCSFMAFCRGISSCFCCECPFFCNQAAVTDFSLRWRLLMFWSGLYWCCVGSNYTFICPWSLLAVRLALACTPHLIMEQLSGHSVFYFLFVSLAEI